MMAEKGSALICGARVCDPQQRGKSKASGYRKHEVLNRNNSIGKGSTRLRRVVCGVSPQTSSHHFVRLEVNGIWSDEIDGETPSMARETRALPKTN